jgi:hypothetical protein
MRWRGHVWTFTEALGRVAGIPGPTEGPISTQVMTFLIANASHQISKVNVCFRIGSITIRSAFSLTSTAWSSYRAADASLTGDFGQMRCCPTSSQ